jgi:hypothetical protein
MQRNAVQHSSPNMALSGGSVQMSDNPLYRDTQPLLGVQMVPAGVQMVAGMGAVPAGMVAVARPQQMAAPVGGVVQVPPRS